jgi:hypothetical protein
MFFSFCIFQTEMNYANLVKLICLALERFGRHPQKNTSKNGECDETIWHIDGDGGAWRCAGGERPGCGI